MTAAATSGGSYDVAIGTVMRYVDDAKVAAHRQARRVIQRQFLNAPISLRS